MDKDIICLSSDDEIEQRKNAQLVANTKSDVTIVQAKEESLSSENEEKEAVVRKRKTTDTIDSLKKQKGLLSEKRIKLSPSKKDNHTSCSNSQCKDEDLDRTKDISQKNEDNKKIAKPQLVVKKRKSISQVEQDVFPMFISLCLQKDRSSDMEVIVGKLKRRYEQLDREYVLSEAFTNLLNEKRDAIMESNSKLYVHIMDVMSEMKSKINNDGNKSKHKKSCELEVTTQQCETVQLTASTSKAASISQSRTSVVQEAEEENNDVEVHEEQTAATSKKVRKLLKAMKLCEKRIKQLEETEVNFDDDNDSAYMLLEKYKERMVKLYNAYCDQTGEKHDAGRVYLRPKHISATGIVKVDQAITSFINSQIFNRNRMKSIGSNVDAIIFPDYIDILECITKCNNMYDLGLEKTKQQEIAKKAFIQLGEYLQRARRNDYWDTFSLFLEDKKEEDPALGNTELEKALVKNKEIGDTRLNEVFEEFVRKQEERRDQQDDNGTSTSNEDEESNENDDIEEIPSTSETREKKTKMNDTRNGKEVVIESNETDENSKEAGDEDDIEVIPLEENEEEKGKEIKKDNNDEKSEKSNVSPIKIITPTSKIDTVEVSSDKNRHVNANESIGRKPEITQTITLNNKLVCKIAPLKATILEPVTSATLDDTNKEKETTKTQSESSDRDIVQSKTQSESPTIDKGTREDEMAEIATDENKPLLRVRSFAKPPTTWEDELQKAERSSKSAANSSNAVSAADIVDLTNESPKSSGNDSSKKSNNASSSIKVTSNATPVSLIKCKPVTLPNVLTRNIIRVKNVTNTYVNTTDLPSVQVISSKNSNVQPTVIGKSGRESTIIHVQPRPSSSQQIPNNANETVGTSNKHGSTVVKILPIGKTAIILTKVQSLTTTNISKTSNATSTHLAKKK